VKQKGIEEELSFVRDWHKKKILLISGIDTYSHESYFDTIKITEDFLE
jgi:hypothetical protein